MLDWHFLYLTRKKMKANLADLLNRIPGPISEKCPEGERFAKAFSQGTMSVELYAPIEQDSQTPHEQNELYFIVKGKSDFVLEDKRMDVAAGDTVFVPARAVHRFENFSDDFATWAVFWGGQRTVNEQIEHFEETRRKAIGGDPEAIEEVIRAYQNGDGVEPDAHQAFEWQKLAVKQEGGKGNNAYFDIAIAYLDGVGTPRDLTLFEQFMTKAAEEPLGNTEAMFKLAEAHANGTLGEISPKKAFEWTLKMADKGAAGGMVEVARAYKTGRGVVQDKDKHLKWSRKAVCKANTAKKEGLKAEAEADTSGGNETKPKFDWTDEDLPRALLELAEASLENSKKKKLIQRAADEAYIAIERFQEKKKDIPIPLDIIEIMHRQAKTYEDEANDCKVDDSNAGVYLEWLEKIAKAIQSVISQGDSKLSAKVSNDLAGAIYKLAKGYRDGTFVAKDDTKYKDFLRAAVEANSAEAHFEFAQSIKTDNVEYQEHIDEAVRRNHMEAFIVDSLNKDGVTSETATYPKLRDHLKDLSVTVTKIKKEFLYTHDDNSNKFVAHYTDYGALTSMLSGNGASAQNVVRLGNILYCNDPDEGKRLISAAEDSHPLRKFFGSTEPIYGKDLDFFVHLGSFTRVDDRQDDRLDLWRAYGRDGTGYCVVTPLSAFPDDSHKPFMSGGWTDQSIEASAVALSLYQVQYGDDAVKKALDAISPVLSEIWTLIQGEENKKQHITRAVRTIVSELLYLYKSGEYSSEKEVRMLSALHISNPALKRDELRTPPRLYIETPPLLFEPTRSKIIIGPKVNNKEEVMVDLQHRLAIRGWSDNCTVKQSTIKYR